MCMLTVATGYKLMHGYTEFMSMLKLALPRWQHLIWV
jgi:hypothetical protein